MFTFFVSGARNGVFGDMSIRDLFGVCCCFAISQRI
ncbi:unnamed protein product [Callosobruchus maculatus]|uniref:Uncharacterized protein n=1 Tax=Callosobruchus maculatus TaxID=64391 RepID=A0A653DMH0_CALMS|nr:unnamed protein product [Callosobruchus maculatus]